MAPPPCIAHCAVLQGLGDLCLDSEGFCRPGAFVLPSVCSQTGFCSYKSLEFKLFARLSGIYTREGTRGEFMTKPGAEREREDFRLHRMTKNSLYNKARCDAAWEAGLTLPSSQPEPFKFKGKICKLVWINMPPTPLCRLNFWNLKQATSS